MFPQIFLICFYKNKINYKNSGLRTCQTFKVNFIENCDLEEFRREFEFVRS